jgi:hypothetical protein
VLHIIPAHIKGVLGGLTAGSDLGDLWWKTLVFDFLASANKTSLFYKNTPNRLIWGYNVSSSFNHLIFDTHQDTFLEFLNVLQPGTPTLFQLQPNQTSIEDSYLKVPPSVTYTGKDDPSKTGEFVLWNNMSVLTCWSSPSANTIGGNDATRFKTNVQETDILSSWVEQLLR